jgi:SAM-dependent methyltransferase
MTNPNDATADIYDIYTQPSKGSKITSQELALIESLVLPGKRILDVGSGTGRHAIPLAQAGFELVAVDSSVSMIKVLRSKQLNIYAEATSIFDFVIESKFDLIILMWNVFNEIALNQEAGRKLLAKLKQLLSSEGQILINIDNPNTFDPCSLMFETDYAQANNRYHLHWQVMEYQDSVTTSHETITVTDDKGIVIRKTTSQIKQRWWDLSEIRSLGAELGLKVVNHILADSVEYYLVLS